MFIEIYYIFKSGIYVTGGWGKNILLLVVVVVVIVVIIFLLFAIRYTIKHSH